MHSLTNNQDSSVSLDFRDQDTVQLVSGKLQDNRKGEVIISLNEEPDGTCFLLELKFFLRVDFINSWFGTMYNPFF